MNIPILDLKGQAKELEEVLMPKIREWFLSGGYIGGEHVKTLEKDLEKYLNVKHAITVGNGTDALVIALRACNIKENDEVITTPFSFFATSEAIASVGAKPVYVDIKEDTFVIDEEKIEKHITSKTKAIMPVHIFGHPCNLDKIYEIANKYNLAVIEDACQAIGSKYNEKMIGSCSEKVKKSITCFSFFPTKNLGACGDAGLITTNNDELDIIMRALKEHAGGQMGMQAKSILEGKDGEEEITDVDPLYNPYKYYNYLIGYNSRMDSIQAIILGEKLKHLDKYNSRRNEIATFYKNSFKEISDLIMPKVEDNVYHCFHQFALKTQYKKELNKFLIDNGVSNAEFYPVPLHLQKALLYLGYKEGDFPVAEKVCTETICLPVFPDLNQEQLDYIALKVKEFYEKKGN